MPDSVMLASSLLRRGTWYRRPSSILTASPSSL
ncbi:unnamed protein product [Gulo gulo]|uniref:Uncharacterized protein n=1 Tax=Gulo gulo TaxID=48420 RepID=A0A9X9M2F3_GULGU|nr:unnamed protein product [Gulo gulo]